MRAAAFRSRVANLKLPRRIDAKAPQMGCVVIPQYDAKSARQKTQQDLFYADSVLLRCIRLVFDESYWLRENMLVDTRLDKLEPPCTLANFTAMQNASMEAVKARLHTVWLPAVEAIVTQELGGDAAPLSNASSKCGTPSEHISVADLSPPVPHMPAPDMNTHARRLCGRPS